MLKCAIKGIAALLLVMTVVSAPAGAVGQDVLAMARAAGQAEGKGTDVPLGDQLEGLAPAPRIAYLRHLLMTGDPSPEIYFQLGVAFHESDEPDSAIHYYTRAVGADPSYTKAFVNMGVLYDDQGRSVKALQMFEEAAKLNTNDILAHAHAAFIRYNFKDYESAWDLLNRALEIDPDNPQPHFYLAIFFWENGIYREALKEWERVVVLDAGGSLARKARENITMLQSAMNAPGGSGNAPVK